MAGELLLVLHLKRAGNYAQHSEGTLLATINPMGDREDETIPRARGEGARFSRSLLRSAKFLLQNRATLRNAVRTSLPLVSSEKPTANILKNCAKRPF